MPSTNNKPIHRRVRLAVFEAISWIIPGVLCIALLYGFPPTRDWAISLFHPPSTVHIPTFIDTGPITPETIANAQLSEYGGRGTFKRVSWSPDGRYLAIMTDLGISLYDGQSYQFLWSIDFPDFTPSVDKAPSLAFSPDGYSLAVGWWRSILLIDLPNIVIRQRWELNKAFVSIGYLAYLANGTLICATDPEGSVRASVLKLVNGNWQAVSIWHWEFGVDHTAYLQPLAFALDKQGILVPYEGWTGLIDPITELRRPLSYAMPPPGSTYLADDLWFTWDHYQHLISIFSGDGLQQSIEWDRGQPFASPDGHLLIAVEQNPNSEYWTINILKVPELMIIRSIWVPEMEPTVAPTFEPSFAFSPTDDRLAWITSDSEVRIFTITENIEWILNGRVKP